MPVRVAARILKTSSMESLAMASRFPDITVLNGSTLASSGLAFTTAGTRSKQYTICEYMGCSTHRVPSWSKVAMRSAGGTNFGLPCVVVASTNLTIACLAAPSFQEGSGSVWARTWVPKAGPATTASANTRRCRAFHFMTFSSGWSGLGRSGRPPHEDARPFRSVAGLVARVAALVLELVHHLAQVVAGRGLQRRERL